MKAAMIELQLSVATAIVIVFAILCLGEWSMLDSANTALKTMPHTLMCFDETGQPTHGPKFKECYQVQYRKAN